MTEKLKPYQQVDEKLTFFYTTYGRFPDSITMSWDFYSKFFFSIKEHLLYEEYTAQNTYKGLDVYRANQLTQDFVIGESVYTINNE